MVMIYIRAKEGLKAFFRGKVIPQDKFVPVPDVPYIRRLVHTWKDVEVEGGDGGKPSKNPEKQPMRAVPGADATVTPSNPPAPGTGSPGPKA
jgi:hypothetical protein